MRPIVEHLETSAFGRPLTEWDVSNDLSHKLAMGEVCPAWPIKSHELIALCPAVLQMLARTKYKLAGNKRPPPDMLVVKGNVSLHSDCSGIIALTLLKVQPFSEDSNTSFNKSPWEHANYLWSQKTLIEMKEGTTVIFDTNQEHAWFCSGLATFLSVPVLKQRVRTMV